MIDSEFEIEPGGGLELFRQLEGESEALRGSGPHSGRRVGHFLIGDLIGRGGMGLVYRGTDEVLDRAVAIKALRFESGSLSTKARSRLLREAKALARLDHPGICRVHDLVEDQDERFIVLELIEGQPLSTFLSEQPSERVSRDEALRLTGEVAEALVAAHEAGVVHRDLKPDNVMVQPDGKARVTDFGIARWRGYGGESSSSPPRELDGRTVEAPTSSTSLSSESKAETPPLTETGSLVGTPAYMSPEQRRTQSATSASDIYSLGLILYELVVGKRALDGSLRTLMLSTEIGLESVPESYRDLQPLLADMLVEDPDQRIDAVELVARIKDLRQAPVRRRQMAIFAGLAFLLISAIVIASWSTRELRRDRQVIASLPNPLEILILPFEVSPASPELEWVENGLRVLVADALSASDRIAVVSVANTSELLSESPDPRLADLVSKADAGAALAVEVKVEGEDYVLRQRLVTADGRTLETRIEGDEPTTAARALADNLLEVLDPSAVARAVHSGDPFVDRLYSMAITDAEKGSDPEAARVLLDRCVELRPGFYRALLARAFVHVFAKRWQQASADLELVRQRPPDQDRELDLEATSVAGDLLGNRGELDRARAELESGLARLDQSPDDDLWRARFINELGQLHLNAEQPIRATALLEQAEVIYRRANKRFDLLVVLLRRAAAAEQNRQFDAGLVFLDEAQGLAEELEVDRRLAQIYNTRGNLLEGRGDLEAALDAYSRSGELARTTGNQSLLQALLNNRATILINLGDFEEAKALLTESLAAATAMGQRHNVALVSFNLAHVNCQLGDAEAASQALDTAQAFYGDDWDVRYFRGWIALLNGDLDSARTILEAAKRDAGSFWSANEEATLVAARTGSTR